MRDFTTPLETLQSFARFIARNMGLHFSTERLPELAQKMAALGREAGHEELKGYLLELMSAPLSQERMKSLAAALTIGETYFLRDPKSYRVLEEKLLPELIAARRRGDRTLRIWSAGCSSGEEPYSIAILLSRMLPEFADWKVTLLATDINPMALERGVRGVYSKWSFRNAPSWLMEYFTQEPDGNYRILPRIRDMVSFAHLNLAAPSREAAALTGGMDVIFCRNVMLYFHEEQIAKTVALLHRSLKAGGWLFVGPTEVDHQRLPGFSCHHFEGALALRKTAATARRGQEPAEAVGPARSTARSAARPARLAGSTAGGASSPPAPPSPSPAPPAGETVPGDEGGSLKKAQELYDCGRYQEAARAFVAASGEAEGTAALEMAARSFANIGSYAEARGCCEKALAQDRLNPRTHYLHSIILEQQDDGEGALRSLRNALYIDHDYLLAYFALGNLCRRRGELKEAEQSFANALRLLRERDPHEVLPETDGMTAGSLAQLITDLSHRPA